MKRSECSEVKGKHALNPTRSPENSVFWWEPILSFWAQVKRRSAEEGERGPSPRGLRRHRAAQRFANNRASDEQGLLGKREEQYPSTAADVKIGVRKAASRAMETGTPQRLAMKRGNARRAKVSTDGRPARKKHRLDAKREAR